MKCLLASQAVTNDRSRQTKCRERVDYGRPKILDECPLSER